MLTTSFLGDGLIKELMSRDRMSADEARAWIEELTGFEFDSDAMYKLSWPGHKGSYKWGDTGDLRLRIMTDPELYRSEVESRKFNKQPPLKLFNEPMFKRAYGRADAARSISRKRET